MKRRALGGRCDLVRAVISVVEEKLFAYDVTTCHGRATVYPAFTSIELH